MMATAMSNTGIAQLQPQVALPSRTCKLAIVGFGTVGSAVANLLSQSAFPQLQLQYIYNRNVDRKRAGSVTPGVRWTEDIEEVFASDVDVIIELAGGLEPATSWIRRALLLGKSVVTANKQVIGAHGPELLELAAAEGCRLEFGAAVAGSVPVLCGLQSLAGDELLKIYGILNGTCNYILSAMEKDGVSFEAALAEAQRRGYAEADPSDDIEGLDARAKLAILVRTAFRVQIQPEQVPTVSINGVEEADFRYAKQLGYTIRQVAQSEMGADCLRAGVRPLLVPLTSPLARAFQNQNVLITIGRHSGETVFSGAGAGGAPTAVAVVSDLLSLSQTKRTAVAHFSSQRRLPVGGELICRHYVRIKVRPDSHAAAQVENVLAECGLSDTTFLANGCGASTRIVFVTDACPISMLQKALHKLGQLNSISDQPFSLPIMH